MWWSPGGARACRGACHVAATGCPCSRVGGPRMYWWLFCRTCGPCRSPGCRRPWSAPPRKYRVACPRPRALPASTTPYLAAPDFCWHRRSPVLTCLQRIYNTVGGNAPPVAASLAPHGSPGACGVRGVVHSLACPSLPPEPRVCCSPRSLSAPLLPVQVYRAVLAASCRLLRALGP